jgi:hypothetical protein
MALMLGNAIYLFNVCLIAFVRELLFLRSQVGVREKTLGFDGAILPRKFATKFSRCASMCR